MNINDVRKFYPTPEELEQWVEEIWKIAKETPIEAEVIDNALLGTLPYMFTGQRLWKNRFVKFSPKGMDSFYAYWQPVDNGPTPLCVHVPGYGAEMSTHPDTVAMGFNVLEINPMGFCTPDGIDTEKRDNPSVLPGTILKEGRGGYYIWLAQCIMAVLWAWKQKEVLPDRVSFYGTSQGGGCTLLLGSLFKNRGVRCIAADEPFLTNYPLADYRGAYGIVKDSFEKVKKEKGEAAAWKALGYVDTVNHAHRLDFPVLLTSGGVDELVPWDTVESLFAELPGVKSYTFLKTRPHGFTPEFVHLAWAWFRIYA